MQVANRRDEAMDKQCNGVWAAAGDGSQRRGMRDRQAVCGRIVGESACHGAHVLAHDV